MFYAAATLYLTNTLVLFTIILVTMVCIELIQQKKRKLKSIPEDGLLQPPTPRKLPIIGHLHLLGGYEVPYQAFNVLGEKFGDVVKLQLGNVKCVVINGQKNIREALVTKGHHFDSRPNFQRYQQLFSGNKENSLAFCDWSDTQRVRRELLKAHTFPRAFTEKFSSLDNTICDEMASIVSQIQPGVSTDLKLIILLHSANIFFKHFCSRSFEVSNPKLLELVENFDEIFYEVNQGHAADFLPFLMHFHKRNMKKMNYLTHKIRNFIENEIIEDRFENYNPDFEPEDYVDSLIHYVRSGNTPILTWDAALFSLEDIIGGHSAVANFLTKVFAFLVTEAEVQKTIQQEIDSVVGCNRLVNINDRNSMPFTQAVIYEAIRLIASPIVPRVASQNSSIGVQNKHFLQSPGKQYSSQHAFCPYPEYTNLDGETRVEKSIAFLVIEKVKRLDLFARGYRIEKGSVLFLNNYDLSMSDELWEEPNKFLPKRFIKNGKLVKPDHFLPFGGGRRSCMGYRMVHLLSFGIIGGLLQHFSIIPVEGECYKVPVGSLALKKDTFKFQFVRR